MSRKLSIAANSLIIAAFSQNVAYAEMGIGLGVASVQAAYKDVDAKSSAFPNFYYEGERLSASFDSMSYRLIKADNFELSLLGKIRITGYEPKDSPALAGMKKRNYSVDLGISGGCGGNWGILSVSAVADASNTHDGQEIEATYLAPFGGDNWSLTPYFGARWQSKDLIDYYYGVRRNEARPGRQQYTGKDTFNTFIGVDASYQLSQNWLLIGGIDYTHLGDEITQSPIVGREYETIGYASLSYIF